MVWDDDSLSPEVQPMSLPETHCWAVVCGTKIWTVKFSSLSRQQDYVMLPTGLCLKHGSELAAPVSGIYSPFAQQLPQNTSHRTHINTSDLVGGGKLELLTRDQPFSTTAKKKKKRKKKRKMQFEPISTRQNEPGGCNGNHDYQRTGMGSARCRRCNRHITSPPNVSRRSRPPASRTKLGGKQGRRQNDRPGRILGSRDSGFPEGTVPCSALVRFVTIQFMNLGRWGDALFTAWE